MNQTKTADSPSSKAAAYPRQPPKTAVRTCTCSSQPILICGLELLDFVQAGQGDVTHLGREGQA